MELVQAKSINDWKKIHKVYMEAFPEYERKPFWIIWRMQKRGITDVWCLMEEDKFVGFASTMSNGDLVLLDYFAIDRNCRGGGFGSKALRLLQQQYKGKKFFLEIESVYEDVPNLAERKRRKQFYLANGMTEMRMMVKLFGTKMEVLGYQCKVEFARYHTVYEHAMGNKFADKVVEETYPECE